MAKKCGTYPSQSKEWYYMGPPLVPTYITEFDSIEQCLEKVNNTFTSTQNYLNKFNKTISLFGPGSAENITIFYTDVRMGIYKVAESIRGTTPSCSYNINFAATRNSSTPTKLFSSDRTVVSPSGVVTTTFADAIIPANSWVWMTTSASAGVINDLGISILYQFK